MNSHRSEEERTREADQFFRESMQRLRDAAVPFLVGGASALAVYTGIRRQTKDFDLLVKPVDVDATLDVFRRAGDRADKTYPHWLGKAFRGDARVDIIYRAGNGLCEVDDSWFGRAPQREVLGMAAGICAPEEMIWMKAYIMERERYDGADIAHLLESCAEQIEWDHLVGRFGPDWPLLLNHLVLFSFIYPSERHRLPRWVMDSLLHRLREENTSEITERVCRGTLLSRAQYLIDIRERGFRDARLDPRCHITAAELQLWTAEIPESEKHLRSVRG